MEAAIARVFQVILAMGGAYLVALWFTLIIWTYRDAETRSRSVFTQIFATLMVVLFFIPGVLLYLILRPKETLDSAFQRSLEEEYLLQDLEELPLCPSCSRYVEDDFQLCPHCQTTLRHSCPACTRLVELRWPVCPYCGVEQGRKERVAAVAEELPQRWVAPAAVRRRRQVEVWQQPPQPAPAPTIAPEPAAAVMDAAPLRLFDRRKTREMAQQLTASSEIRLTGTDTGGPQPMPAAAPAAPTKRVSEEGAAD